jgi:hypothetical protein
MIIPPKSLFRAVHRALRNASEENTVIVLTFALAAAIVAQRPRRDDAMASANVACRRITDAIGRELPEPEPPPPRPRLVWSQPSSPRASTSAKRMQKAPPRARGRSMTAAALRALAWAASHLDQAVERRQSRQKNGSLTRG